ncbi:hypothetical protein HDU76_007431, partial [Blyttiomyces sp. JEL0837]
MQRPDGFPANRDNVNGPPQTFQSEQQGVAWQLIYCRIPGEADRGKLLVLLKQTCQGVQKVFFGDGRQCIICFDTFPNATGGLRILHGSGYIVKLVPEPEARNIVDFNSHQEPRHQSWGPSSILRFSPLAYRNPFTQFEWRSILHLCAGFIKCELLEDSWEEKHAAGEFTSQQRREGIHSVANAAVYAIFVDTDAAERVFQYLSSFTNLGLGYPKNPARVLDLIRTRGGMIGQPQLPATNAVTTWQGFGRNSLTRHHYPLGNPTFGQHQQFGGATSMRNSVAFEISQSQFRFANQPTFGHGMLGNLITQASYSSAQHGTNNQMHASASIGSRMGEVVASREVARVQSDGEELTLFFEQMSIRLKDGVFTSGDSLPLDTQRHLRIGHEEILLNRSTFAGTDNRARGSSMSDRGTLSIPFHRNLSWRRPVGNQSSLESARILPVDSDRDPVNVAEAGDTVENELASELSSMAVDPGLNDFSPDAANVADDDAFGDYQAPEHNAADDYNFIFIKEFVSARWPQFGCWGRNPNASEHTFEQTVWLGSDSWQMPVCLNVSILPENDPRNSQSAVDAANGQWSSEFIQDEKEFAYGHSSMKFIRYFAGDERMLTSSPGYPILVFNTVPLSSLPICRLHSANVHAYTAIETCFNGVDIVAADMHGYIVQWNLPLGANIAGGNIGPSQTYCLQQLGPAVALSYQGGLNQTVVVGAHKSTISVIDGRTARGFIEFARLDNATALTCLKCNPNDKNQVLSGDAYGEIVVWDLRYQ